MFGAILKGIGQLGYPPTRRLLWVSVGVAIVVFALLWAVMGYLLTNTAIFDIWLIETAVDFLAGAATLVLTWIFFPAVLSAVSGLLLDRVAETVEARHYPHLPKAGGSGIADEIVIALRFLIVLIVFNMFVLIFMLVPPLFPFVFYGVNGYLLGREYFELVALRRVGSADARSMRKAHGFPLFLTGLVIAFLLTVPVVNLLAPVIATAAMVHLFESWRGNRAAA